jgi:hypothetical protein
MLYRQLAGHLFLVAVLCSPAAAAWRPAGADVAAAARDERIAGALAAVDKIDLATTRDDRASFAAVLADDLAVNNPQNGVSVRGATGRRSEAGQISYTRYDRVIEYAGLRAGMVLLMGEEIVVSKAPGEPSNRTVHRRFTDLWKLDEAAWKLTARQATIIARP